jgi:integrase
MPRRIRVKSRGSAGRSFQCRAPSETSALAAALKNAKGDRPADALLLRKRDGTAWQATSTVDHRDLFRRAVERAELGVAGVTSYALRHSSIVRALLGGVPVAVAAQLHDTSVREIEAHYAAFILDHSDALTRRTLLDTAAPLIAERWPRLRGVGT